jgi:hypothetical protein
MDRKMFIGKTVTWKTEEMAGNTKIHVIKVDCDNENWMELIQFRVH